MSRVRRGERRRLTNDGIGSMLSAFQGYYRAVVTQRSKRTIHLRHGWRGLWRAYTMIETFDEVIDEQVILFGVSGASIVNLKPVSFDFPSDTPQPVKLTLYDTEGNELIWFHGELSPEVPYDVGALALTMS